jgi:hypothetical protein
MKRLFRILDFRQDPTQDVRDEIESHLEFEVERLTAGGLSEEEARKEAERRFGDRGQLESEAARHATRWEGKKRWTARFDTFRQDLPFAVRTLLRARGMTALTLLLLTLGIGGNTALYSTLKGVYLEPLPLPESQELVFLWERSLRTRTFQAHRWWSSVMASGRAGMGPIRTLWEGRWTSTALGTPSSA